MTDKSTII